MNLSAGNESAQPASFHAGAMLQFLVAQLGFLPLLGCQHITFFDWETFLPGQLQEGLKVELLLQLLLQRC